MKREETNTALAEREDLPEVITPYEKRQAKIEQAKAKKKMYNVGDEDYASRRDFKKELKAEGLSRKARRRELRAADDYNKYSDTKSKNQISRLKKQNKLDKVNEKRKKSYGELLAQRALDDFNAKTEERRRELEEQARPIPKKKNGGNI